MTTSAGIFISYRRRDSPGCAGRLSDRLIDRFGQERVFMDVDGIDPGEDFWRDIQDVLTKCSIVLVVIGDEWLSLPSASGRKVDDPNDYVRREVAAALARGVTTVPVLVNGAQMPAEHELPDEIAHLSRLNAVELRDTRWRDDVDNLASWLASRLVTSAEVNDEDQSTSAPFEEVSLDDWYRTGGRKRYWPWQRRSTGA